MITSTRKTVARLTLIAVLATSGIALAGSYSLPGSLEPASITVSFRDLNVANPEGARVLYDRIRAAARKVCGSNSAPWYPGQGFSSRKCYNQTVDRAVNQVNRPMLTALHQKRVSVASR